MRGKLIKITNGPLRDKSASNEPDEIYRTWTFTLEQSDGEEVTATSGRLDLALEAVKLLGEQVQISRGGKCGIVGALRKAT